MAIYLDAVWLLNFLFDWMILQLAHWLTKSSTPRGRLILGAFVASLLVPLTIFYPNQFFATFLGKIIFSTIIIYAAFGMKNWKMFMKQLFSFYFVSFALGGGLFGIYFLIGQQIHAADGLFITYSSGYGDMVSWIFVVIFFPIVWFFTKRRLEHITFEKIRYEEMCAVTIMVNNERIETVGLIDSGNSLVDPFTKKPVIVCDEVALEKCFTPSEWEQLKECQQDWSFENLPEKWLTKMRIIPFQGVGGKRSFLIVFKPDKIIVNYEKVQFIHNKVLIGIQFGELASDGSYHCLLHPKMVQGPKLQALS